MNKTDAMDDTEQWSTDDDDDDNVRKRFSQEFVLKSNKNIRISDKNETGV